MRAIRGTLLECIEKTKAQISQLKSARQDPTTFDYLVTCIELNTKVIERGFADISAATDKANDFLVYRALIQEVGILVC